MKSFQIKVCGMTRVADAVTAARLGADMLGFIFYRKSPRYVSVRQARAIVREIPSIVDRVGVFVGDDVDSVLRRARTLKLDYVQYHGPLTARDTKKLRGAGLKIIQCYHVTSQRDYDAVFRSNADLVLLDNRSGNLPGGTGKTFDWGVRPPRRITNLVLAGGLTRDNVAQGVNLFEPLVVDVNSGVEQSPGRKSPAKLKSFFHICDRIRYGST